MTMEYSQEFVVGQLKWADEALSDAEYLLKDNRLRAAANRAYYAMFYAAQAVLSQTDTQLPKTHSGVINQFGLHVARPGIVDRQLGAHLRNAYRLRIRTDYELHAEYADDLVAETVQNARAFVSAIRRALDLPR